MVVESEVNYEMSACSAEVPTSALPKKTSFNGELNGVLGAEFIGPGDSTGMATASSDSPETLNTQDCQTMLVLSPLLYQSTLYLSSNAGVVCTNGKILCN